MVSERILPFPKDERQMTMRIYGYGYGIQNHPSVLRG